MSPPSSAEMSTFIFSRCRPSPHTSSPLIGPPLSFGNRVATSGPTREQAGQSVLQFVGFLTSIFFSVETPYTSNRQKVRHCMQLVQRLKSITGNHGFHFARGDVPARA